MATQILQPRKLTAAEAINDRDNYDGVPLIATMFLSHGSVPILVTTIMILVVFFFMYWFQRCWKRKYSLYARELDINMSADNMLIKLLTNFSFTKVEQHKFRGITAKRQTVTVEFDSLGTSLMPPNRIMRLFTGQGEKKPVLKSVSGKFYPRRLSAIMGPSGAGKTTFLNVLCGKYKSGSEWEVHGKVMINGKEQAITELKPVTGFVPQDDIVHEQMTVRENIRFSAVLRNARGTSRSKIRLITDDVLQVLQLAPNQNVLVGNRTRGGGLSGGQRKRVNVGMELAANPTLLFLDEPTSGLDATSSLLLVKQLRKMAKLGMTIVMVIHQPRYALFTLIDDVLLLGKGGRTVYIGPTVEAKEYFEGLGFIMPSNENAADWMMDLMSGQVEERLSKIPKGELPEALFKAWDSREERRHQGDADNESPGNVVHATTSLMRLPEEDAKSEELIRHHIKEHWGKFAPEGGHLNEGEFAELLMSCTGSAMSDDVVSELMTRIAGPEEKEVSQHQLVRYLLGYQGLIKTDSSLQQIADTMVEWDRAESDASQESDESDDDDEDTLSEGDDEDDDITSPMRGVSTRRGRSRRFEELNRRQPGFLYQLRVELHRRSLVWWRSQTQLALFLGVVLTAAVVLGVFDAFVFESPKWFPTGFLNAHISLALLTSVYCGLTFSEDQPVFWREASHGLNRFSFMLGRTLVNSIDWFVMCYLFTATYYLITMPSVNYLAWSTPDFLVAWVAAGWGYMIACWLPRELGPFVAALVAFVLGGILGLPDKMGIFLNGSVLEWSVSILSFTRWSVPMSFISYTNLYPPNTTELDPLEYSQLTNFRSFYDQASWNIHDGERHTGYWRTGALALLVMGLVLRYVSYLGLLVMNRGKQA